MICLWDTGFPVCFRLQNIGNRARRSTGINLMFPSRERVPSALPLFRRLWKTLSSLPASHSRHVVWAGPPVRPVPLVSVESSVDMEKTGRTLEPMLRRLEDRIRSLCCKALTAGDRESDAVFRDLRSALHQHTERLRQLAALKLVSAKEGIPPERRSGQTYLKGTEKSGRESPE
jgi:hypothetical protein